MGVTATGDTSFAPFQVTFTSSLSYNAFSECTTKLDASYVQVVFATLGKDDDSARFEKLELSPDVADRFRSIAQATFDELQDDLLDGTLEIRPYAASKNLLERHEVEYVDISTQPYIQSQIAPLSAPMKMDPFEARDDTNTEIRYYVIILQLDDQPPIYCFRSYAMKWVLHRSFFAIVKGRGSDYYDDVPGPGFIFDSDIECISQGDHLFILNKDKFQRIFQFYAYVRKKADTTISRLKKLIAMANWDEFELACQLEVRLASAVANLEDAPHLDRLSMSKIKRFIEENDYGLRDAIVEQDGQQMLVYSGSYKWPFIRLLSDNYLWSRLTDVDYEVNSKRALQNGQ